jgi:signal transduction histidine kinase
MKYDFLRNIPLFVDLPEIDLKQLCGKIEEVHLLAGEELFEEGSSGDRAYVIRSGEVEIVKYSSEGEMLLAVRGSGDVIGEIALIDLSPRSASVRARTDCLLYAITNDQFDDLLSTSPSAANVMFRTILRRWRDTESKLRQSEKMAQLGTLTAGVAHELNNPAAAVKRSASHLHGEVERYAQANVYINQQNLTENQGNTLAQYADRAREFAVRPTEMDALVRSDRQMEIEDWLEDRELSEAWDFAPTLVELNFNCNELEVFIKQFAPNQFTPILDWLCAIHSVFSLIAAIGVGTDRISEIVKALKSYSYLDQAPVQNIDVHQGLDDTLVILSGKLKSGINVRREYANDLPKIHAYGSELNQVWTNIIDNAIDALDGGGEIVLRTRQEGDWVVVEIEDNGQGIPQENQTRIFDPFYTTKPPGKGTGLGLDISYNIIVKKHKGNIKVNSKPGETCFQIWLPLDVNTASYRVG